MATTLTTARIKKLISDPQNRIELHDLVHEETERLYGLVAGMDPQSSGEAIQKAKTWIEQVEAESKTLREIFTYGCYFGTDDQAYIWSRSLNRLGGLVHNNGLQIMINLQLYPALLVMYAGGVSAIAAGNSANLNALLSATYKEPHNQTGLLVTRANGWLLDANEGNAALGLGNRKTPLSDHVHDIIASDYPESLIVKDDFALQYDRWEVLLGMVVAHHLKERTSGPWAPVGRFAWRSENNGQNGLKLTAEEIEMLKTEWPPLKARLFDGSVSDALAAHEYVKGIASRVGFF